VKWWCDFLAKQSLFVLVFLDSLDFPNFMEVLVILPVVAWVLNNSYISYLI
jgi:hypothetical protein